MVQTVPKWKVTVRFPDRQMALWIYDISISNVLRKVSEMQFSDNGLEQPTEVVIGNS